ncbi:MAG: DoxX family protein [Mycobacteriaceae bacterium]
MTSPNPDPGWQRPEDSPVRPASARLVDPEDDLAAATYGGDFETTKIPPFGAPAAPAASIPEPTPSSTAYGLLHDPEPLPYVQPIPETSHPSAAPVEIAPVDAEKHAKAAGRRGTQDLGLLLLRVSLGVVFIAHGLQKAFGWWGGSGLDGFKGALTEAGYQHAGLLTYVAAGVQIAAGVLLVLGLFTPVAAAGALAFLVNSVLVTFSAQRKNGGLFVFGSDAEYLLVLVAVAAAIILIGPGRYGFDGGRGWARRPFIGSFLALLLGIGGGVAAWLFLHGINPFA